MPLWWKPGAWSNAWHAHDGTNDGIAERAEDSVGDSAEDEGIARDFTHGQDVKRDKIQEQVDAHDRKYASEDRARDVTTGIANFTTEINDAVPTVDGVNNALQRQQNGDGERPAGW